MSFSLLFLRVIVFIIELLMHAVFNQNLSFHILNLNCVYTVKKFHHFVIQLIWTRIGASLFTSNQFLTKHCVPGISRQKLLKIRCLDTQPGTQFFACQKLVGGKQICTSSNSNKLKCHWFIFILKSFPLIIESI